MSHVYVSMFGPMPAQPTGLAMSVLRRAQAFANAGISTDILIDKFYPDYEQHAANLTDSGALGNTIRLRNIFFDIAGQEPHGLETKYISPLGIDGWIYTPDEKRPEVSRGYLNDDYKHFVWTRDEGSIIHFIDQLEDNGTKRISRDWHDSAGLLCKRDVMAPNNKPERIEYIRHDGTLYLIESLDAELGTSLGWTIMNNDKKPLNFSTFEELYLFWLNKYVLQKDEVPTFISEYGFHRNSLQTIERTHQATVVYTFHSNHLGGDHTYGSQTRSDQIDFIENLHAYASVVLLTQEQRLDLWKQSGYSSNLHVIPHHLPISGKQGKRDHKKVVMIGRFDRDKGHEDALRAFKRTLAQVPDATMDFYGRGADEGRIRQLISELKLSNVVRIMGFTADSFQVFADSAVSLVPSSLEGFCLSLAESMASGCVPIAYDFKYGPRSLINNGVDGLIVELGNIQDLSDAMTLVLRENGYRASLSEQARKISERLTEKSLIDGWRNVLRDAKRKPKPPRLSDSVSRLTTETAVELIQRLANTVDSSGSINHEQFENILKTFPIDHRSVEA